MNSTTFIAPSKVTEFPLSFLDTYIMIEAGKGEKNEAAFYEPRMASFNKYLNSKVPLTFQNSSNSIEADEVGLTFY